MAAKDLILDLLKKNVGKRVPSSEIRKKAKISDWARCIRTLRQEGWKIELSRKDGGGYKLVSLSKGRGVTRTQIDAKTAYLIRSRDNFVCQACGKNVRGKENHIDHIVPVDFGGTNELDNLQLLCKACNLGKKNLYKEQDKALMKKIFASTSSKERLRLFFEGNPNKLLSPSVLQGVAHVRDWERALRYVRSENVMNIKYAPKSKNSEEGYIYTP